jgi:hypothetical protein
MLPIILTVVNGTSSAACHPQRLRPTHFGNGAKKRYLSYSVKLFDQAIRSERKCSLANEVGSTGGTEVCRLDGTPVRTSICRCDVHRCATNFKLMSIASDIGADFRKRSWRPRCQKQGLGHWRNCPSLNSNDLMPAKKPRLKDGRGLPLILCSEP